MKKLLAKEGRIFVCFCSRQATDLQYEQTVKETLA